MLRSSYYVETAENDSQTASGLNHLLDELIPPC